MTLIVLSSLKLVTHHMFLFSVLLAPGLGPDPNKPACRKAKILRLERKRQKLALAKGEQVDSGWKQTLTLYNDC